MYIYVYVSLRFFISKFFFNDFSSFYVLLLFYMDMKIVTKFHCINSMESLNNNLPQLNAYRYNCSCT